MKNHEGYHDPTAGTAIKRVSKHKRRKKRRDSLTYTMRDVKGFREAVKMIRRK